MCLELKLSNGKKLKLRKNLDREGLIEWIERTLQVVELAGELDPAGRNAEYIQSMLLEARCREINLSNRNYPGWNMDEKRLPVNDLWIARDTIIDETRRRSDRDVAQHVADCLLEVANKLNAKEALSNDDFLQTVFQGYL